MIIRPSFKPIYKKSIPSVQIIWGFETNRLRLMLHKRLILVFYIQICFEYWKHHEEIVFFCILPHNRLWLPFLKKTFLCYKTIWSCKMGKIREGWDSPTFAHVIKNLISIPSMEGVHIWWNLEVHTNSEDCLLMAVSREWSGKIGGWILRSPTSINPP